RHGAAEQVPRAEERAEALLVGEPRDERGVPAGAVAGAGVRVDEVRLDDDLRRRQAALDELLPRRLGRRDVEVDGVLERADGAVGPPVPHRGAEQRQAVHALDRVVVHDEPAGLVAVALEQRHLGVKHLVLAPWLLVEVMRDEDFHGWYSTSGLRRYTRGAAIP